MTSEVVCEEGTWGCYWGPPSKEPTNAINKFPLSTLIKEDVFYITETSTES